MKKILIMIILALIVVNPEIISQTTKKGNKHEYRIKKMKKNLKRTYIPYDKNIPHYNNNIKALFYIVDEKKDTFHYAVQQNDSVFLWAIVKGSSVRLIRDLNGLR